MLSARRARGASLLVLACAAGTAAFATACDDGKSPFFGTTTRVGKPPSVFTMNLPGEPELIDPGRSGEAIGTSLIAHVFEGLTTYDPRDAHPVQGVARAWDRTDDSRLFRFYLRPDAKWTDGKRVTARDFVYAWTRVLRPKTASKSAVVLYALLNGELFGRGLLKVAKRPLEARTAPSDSGPVASTVPAGAAVVVLKTDKEYSQIALHERLPTFDAARPPPPEKKDPPPLGFVKTADLDEDGSVLGVRAVGEDVLEVEAERPTPYFTELAAYSALSPMREDVVEPLVAKAGLDAVNRPENLVTNGPFSFGEWKFHYELDLVKSPTYWRASEVKLDKIVWTISDDAKSTLNLYKTGELDYLGDNTSLPIEAMPFLTGKKDFYRTTILNVYWFELNTKRPPLDDVRVRKALDLAIDKTALVERVTRAGQVPATHYVPDITGSGYSEAAEADRKAGKDPFRGPDSDFDPERARALLREAGYDIASEGDGFKAKGFPALELLYNTNEGNRIIAVAVQGFWKKNLGVTVSLRNEEWKVMLKTRDARDFQILRGGWMAEYNHPGSFLDTFLSYSSQNYTSYSDPESDRLIREAAATGDPALSMARYREAEKRLVAARARIPLYFYTRSTLVKPWVKGFYANARNIHLAAWMWIGDSSSPDNRPAAEPRELPAPGSFARPPGGAP
ncbi:MAG: peptide ABC transporter substrate-binding protein [Polyangiaceae bacterium]